MACCSSKSTVAAVLPPAMQLSGVLPAGGLAKLRDIIGGEIADLKTSWDSLCAAIVPPPAGAQLHVEKRDELIRLKDQIIAAITQRLLATADDIDLQAVEMYDKILTGLESRMEVYNIHRGVKVGERDGGKMSALIAQGLMTFNINAKEEEKLVPAGENVNHIVAVIVVNGDSRRELGDRGTGEPGNRGAPPLSSLPPSNPPLSPCRPFRPREPLPARPRDSSNDFDSELLRDRAPAPGRPVRAAVHGELLREQGHHKGGDGGKQVGQVRRRAGEGREEEEATEAPLSAKKAQCPLFSSSVLLCPILPVSPPCSRSVVPPSPPPLTLAPRHRSDYINALVLVICAGKKLEFLERGARTDFGKWLGLEMGENSRITKIYWPKQKLGNMLSTNIINLEHLVHLNLSHNNFVGRIDPLFKCHSLEHLDISHNKFSGELEIIPDMGLAETETTRKRKLGNGGNGAFGLFGAGWRLPAREDTQKKMRSLQRQDSDASDYDGDEVRSGGGGGRGARRVERSKWSAASGTLNVNGTSAAPLLICELPRAAFAHM